MLRKTIMLFLFTTSLLMVQSLSGQGLDLEYYDLLENKIPQNCDSDLSSTLSMSNRHYKIGEQSLRWDWVNKRSKLVIYEDELRKVVSEPRATFAIWIYNESPKPGNLKFEFSADEEVNCSFDFGLNFQGWRTCWVMYHRDMLGKPTVDMNRLTIVSPDGMEKGTLYFDQIVFSKSINPRHQIRDAQVPFVNLDADKAANSHWMSLYKFSQMEPVLPLPASFSSEQIKSLDTIVHRYEETILEQIKVTDSVVDKLKKKYEYWRIKRSEDGVITGRPIFLTRAGAVLPFEDEKETRELLAPYDVKKYSGLMLNIAQTYRAAVTESHRRILEDLFISMCDHLNDQGWAYGSGLGTMSHLGYSNRNMYPAFFLMRDVLRKNNRLKRSQKTMYWLSGAGKTNILPQEIDGINMDLLNTTIEGQLVSILMNPDTLEMVRDLQQFSTWLDYGMRHANGLKGGFKVDGSAFHHHNHYPAYAIGGFRGLTFITYLLSGTDFRIGKEGHESFHKALMHLRLYSNKSSWPLSVSGRHPTGEQKDFLPLFEYLALSGTPDGMKSIDPEAGAAYLRLLDENESTETSTLLKKEGIQAEKDPNGHWTMNYAALSIHRRENWLATARGHSRYLWDGEIYPGNNMFGRYITFGHLEILYPDIETKALNSGFKQEGWDWNRFAGTTTIHLPIDKLRANVINVDDFSGIEQMLLSDEAFAGGVNDNNGNGIFAMKLHGHDKYDLGSFRANKSLFFFENRIICLGSDIENTIVDYPTETTLFQTYLIRQGEPIFWGSIKGLTEFPFQKTSKLQQATWLVDTQGNGYYLSAGQTLNVHRQTQYSRSEQDNADTQGDFAVAWLDHGKAPKQSAYEYAILVNVATNEIEKFATEMSNSKTAAYIVLQKNKSAHIVRDNHTGSTGYVLFERNNNLPNGFIRSTDRPCLIMARQVKNGLALSISDPDLRLYEGSADEKFDAEGKRIERSIYSRDWRENESALSKTRIAINGVWQAEEMAHKYRIISSKANITIVEFECKDGLTIHALLKKAKL